jgi:calmodulin
MAAFRVFDREGNGTISSAELKHIVTSLGERLSDAEAEELLKQADPNGLGVIEYAKFIDSLLGA